MTDTQKLLAEYAENGSENAFREIVSRYLDLVYSVALRLVNGDAHLAEDVSQTVFIDLARLAGRLSRNTLLGGWLHRHTCFVASKLMRSNRRRQARERQAVEMNIQPDHAGENLAQVTPILDEAINQLGEPDRTALLLRFFEQRDLRSVGDALGASENAAQKRVARALEELRGLLKRRGVTLSAAGLATALAGGGMAAAPAGLAASISTAALAGVAGAGGTGLTLFKFMTMTKLKAGLIGAVAIAGIATPLALEHREQATLRNENGELRQRVARLDQVNAESDRVLSQLANTTRLSQDQLNDLMRLRAEVAALRRQATDAERLREENRLLHGALANSIPDPRAQDPAAQRQKREVIEKLNFSRNWMLAIIQYADKNQGQMPESFEQALPFFSPQSSGEPGDSAVDQELAAQLSPERFEIVYRGSVTNLSNMASAIVLREREAWPNVGGGWNRTYGFADGHSEIHRTDDGNYEAWEKGRLVSSAASNPTADTPWK